MTLVETGKLLKGAREAAGLTRLELAERIGATWSAVARWELGNRRPALVHALALERALKAHGVKVEWWRNRKTGQPVKEAA